MKLYSYWRSSSCWRVRLALEIKEIAYEYVPVNLAPGAAEHHSTDYAQRNPMNQVPSLALVHQGQRLALTQSVAIVELLEDLHPTPPLLPKDPLLRARVREVVEVINSGTQPLQNLSLLQKIEHWANKDESNAWASTQILRGLSMVNALVQPSAGRYCFGDMPTLADVYLVPQLYNARRFGVELTSLDALVAIEGRCAALPAFARAHPDAQPDAPRQT